MTRYEELEAELYHKGHGARMESRNVGSNTKLIRLGDLVALRLHRTNILVWYPDGRMTLSHGGWPTSLTSRRMNDWLGPHNRVSLGKYRSSVHVRFVDNRVSSYEPRWLEGWVPFENGMALDAETGELALHPMDVPVTFDEDAQRLVNRAHGLTPLINEIRQKTREETLTREDINYALKMKEEWKVGQERLASIIRRLETAVNWEIEALEEALLKGIAAHAEKYQSQRERRIELPGQQRATTLVAPVVRH